MELASKNQEILNLKDKIKLLSDKKNTVEESLSKKRKQEVDLENLNESAA